MLIRMAGVVALLMGFQATALDVVTLTAETFEDFAPQGKEADAIFGDIAIRNGHVAVVIAQEGAHRKANMMTGGIAGGLLDFTTLKEQSDLLGVFLPWTPHAFVIFNGIELDGKFYPAQSGYAPVMQGRSVAIQFTVVAKPEELRKSTTAPTLIVRYELNDGDKHITVRSRYENTGDKALKYQVRQYVRMDNSADMRAVTKVSDGDHPTFWAYDQWFDQAYVMQAVGFPYRVTNGAGKLTPSWITLQENETGVRELAPGTSFDVVQHVTCASTLSEALSNARALTDTKQYAFRLHVQDDTGIAIENALVEFAENGDTLGFGRTNASGHYELDLPLGEHMLNVSSAAHGSFGVKVSIPKNESAAVELGRAGAIVAHITDENGGPIPAKVQFKGKEGTETPFLGPDTSENAVHNLRYTHDGQFRQELAEGKYEVIISYGVEYDAIFTDVTVERGVDTPLRATLKRTVDTSHWISSDFHSHSTPSGDNTSSQRGRVLNLLAEHIEFAPCTEHNRLDSYKPHLRALGIEHLMATCTGLELTSSPGGLNHHNVFPLLPRYGEQDNGAPRAALSPEVQIARLAYWDGSSDKLIQQNHPDMPNMFFDRDNNGERDEGYDGMFDYMDVIEIHPPETIFYAPLTDTPMPERLQRWSRRNRMASWLQLWNLGMGVFGVVNTDAHGNYHGSGWLRNWIAAPTDAPDEVKIMDMVHNAKHGHLIMSNGPFLELFVSDGEGEPASKLAFIPGNGVRSKSGEVRVMVNVQCPNWFDIDRVDILVNGQRRDDLIFTREKNPELFSSETIRFKHAVTIPLEEDAHIIAATIGMNSSLGEVMGSQAGVTQPCAVTNPVFVDVDGDGWQPNGDDLGIPLVPGN